MDAVEEALANFFGPTVARSIRGRAMERYEAPGRYYHNWVHAREVATTWCIDSTPELLLAALWHDVVYFSQAPKGENEARSARFARREIYDNNLPVNADRVVELILTTVDHSVVDRLDFDAMTLCDADLRRFAAPWPEFVRHNVDIRKEYAHVSDTDWHAGREAVLQKYLWRDPMYYLSGDAGAAAQNLVRAIKELRRNG